MKHQGKFAILAMMAAMSVAGASAADFTLDFGVTKGRVKRLNGICNTARINNSMHAKSDELPLFKALELPCSRYHDAALVNPGYALVDISRIFPLMHLDADDPRNYIFKPTDDYILRTLETGAEVEFRFGESIEHSKNRYRVNMPDDVEKVAAVCLHIVRHYNAGWANGFKLNIRRWSVWEEPDLDQILYVKDGDQFGAYARLYRAIATAVKREFPDVLVGGPEDCCSPGFRRDLMKMCRDEKVPLDFIMFDSYTRDVEQLFRQICDTRKMMDGFGFKDARLGVSEWHYGPTDFQDLNNNPKKARRTRDDLTGIDAAAYAAAVLSRMQDAPVDDLFYYEATSPTWGLISGTTKFPVYYVFVAFAKLAAKGEAVRVDAPSKSGTGRYLLATRQGDAGYALVTSFKRGDDCRIAVKGAGVRPKSVKVIDSELRLEETADWKADERSGELVLRAPVSCPSAVWLVEWDLKAKSAEAI